MNNELEKNRMANEVIELVKRFNNALNAGDVDGMMRWMTEDCVFENTYPAPDGTRYQGQAENHAFWEAFFQGSSSAHIEVEEIFAAGQRCAMRWRYHWVGSDGAPGHMRGVDLYSIKNGLIAEKLSYVKG